MEPCVNDEQPGKRKAEEESVVFSDKDGANPAAHKEACLESDSPDATLSPSAFAALVQSGDAFDVLKDLAGLVPEISRDTETARNFWMLKTWTRFWNVDSSTCPP